MPEHRSRSYPRAPLLAVGGVVFDRDQVILVRRAHPPLAGTWSLPGGLLEVGETLEDAVAREVLEETGCHVEVQDLVALVDHIEHDPSGRVRFHYVLADYLCRRVGGDLSPRSDAAEARSVAIRDLDELTLTPEVRRVIRAAWEMRSQGTRG